MAVRYFMKENQLFSAQLFILYKTSLTLVLSLVHNLRVLGQTSGFQTVAHVGESKPRCGARSIPLPNYLNLISLVLFPQVFRYANDYWPQNQ